jgi:transposase-like protein
MDAHHGIPATLLDAIQFFADPDASLAFMVQLRWPDGAVICPRCKAAETSFLSTRRLWKCKGCKKQFSAKVGTIFEDSPIALEKWLPALWLVVNCKNGISSYEVARNLGVSQKTAWFMTHRIRLAVQTGTFDKMSGEVEVDETFIGGKARFMHKGKRAEKITGCGPMGKTAVMGLLGTARRGRALDRHRKGRSRHQAQELVPRGAGARRRKAPRSSLTPSSPTPISAPSTCMA